MFIVASQLRLGSRCGPVTELFFSGFVHTAMKLLEIIHIESPSSEAFSGYLYQTLGVRSTPAQVYDIDQKEIGF